MSTEPIKSRQDAEALLIRKALEDESFRRELLADPRRALIRALDIKLPPDVKITVLEETGSQLYLVLPPPPVPAGLGTAELTDKELEAVAGGNRKEGGLEGSKKLAKVFGVGA
jgi:hypothetical protein